MDYHELPTTLVAYFSQHAVEVVEVQEDAPDEQFPCVDPESHFIVTGKVTASCQQGDYRQYRIRDRVVFRGALGEGVLRRGVSRPALCLTERAKPGAKLCTRTVQVELESRCEHKAIRRSVRVKLQAQYPRYAQIFG